MQASFNLNCVWQAFHALDRSFVVGLPALILSHPAKRVVCFLAAIVLFCSGICVPLFALNETIACDDLASEKKAGDKLQKALVHPGIAHTQENIAFVKTQLASKREPWQLSWNQLNRSSFASLNWRPQPRSHVQRGSYNDPNIGASEFIRDGTAAYTHALHWALSGELKHAEKSAEIVDAWADQLKTVTNHDARLLIGMAGHQYCNAAELLKHRWDGWPRKNQKKFESMLRDVWYPVIKDFYPTANGNWDASMLQTMIAMGVFLDDKEMFDRAAEYFRNGKGTAQFEITLMSLGNVKNQGVTKAIHKWAWNSLQILARRLGVRVSIYMVKLTIGC